MLEQFLQFIEQVKGAEISMTLSSGIHELKMVEDDQVDDDNGIITTSLADLFEECKKDLDDIVGVPSGFSHLDRLTGGFQDSDMIIIGARPSIGKTGIRPKSSSTRCNTGY